MEFTLKINMDNAAFEDQGIELSRILHKLAKKTEDMIIEEGGKIMDINGNSVGEWFIVE